MQQLLYAKAESPLAAILVVRTWAVWRLSRRVAILLATMLVATMIPAFYCNYEHQRAMKCAHIQLALCCVLFNRYLTVASPPSPIQGCYVTASSDLVAVEFIILTVVETCKCSTAPNGV